MQIRRFERLAEIAGIRNHRHVNPGVYREFHRTPHVSGDFFARVEIVDVCPVGDNHSVPARFVLEPLSEQNRVAMNRSAID